MKIYTKDTLIEALQEIRAHGWHPNARHGNSGGVGNTIEDLLGIEENNLPIPNAAEWELKCQRANSSSLTTLMHLEPSPRTLSLVSALLLPKYGWRHQKAGGIYGETEMSFRQTINGLCRTDRGFGILANKDQRRVEVSFDSTAVSERHGDWLNSVRNRVGLDELQPQPYWGFDDLFHKAGTKLHNCFYLKAEVKRVDGQEHFKYSTIWMLRGFSREKFVNAIEAGNVLVDFDARTGHNHGTKFRLRPESMPTLYDQAEQI